MSKLIAAIMPSHRTASHENFEGSRGSFWERDRDVEDAPGQELAQGLLNEWARVSRPRGWHGRPLARGLHPLGDSTRALPRGVRTGRASPVDAACVSTPVVESPLSGPAQFHSDGS